MPTIYVIGNKGTGKTSLIKRFQDLFSEKEEPTVGSNILTKNMTIDGEKVTFHIHDFGPEKANKEMVTTQHISEGSIYMLVLDPTAKDYKKQMEQWAKDLRTLPKQPTKMLVVTKYDSIEGDLSKTTPLDTFCKRFCEDNRMLGPYYVSAKTGNQVQDLFKTAATINDTPKAKAIANPVEEYRTKVSDYLFKRTNKLGDSVKGKKLNALYQNMDKHQDVASIKSCIDEIRSIAREHRTTGIMYYLKFCFLRNTKSSNKLAKIFDENNDIKPGKTPHA